MSADRVEPVDANGDVYCPHCGAHRPRDADEAGHGLCRKCRRPLP